MRATRAVFAPNFAALFCSSTLCLAWTSCVLASARRAPSSWVRAVTDMAKALSITKAAAKNMIPPTRTSPPWTIARVNETELSAG